MSNGPTVVILGGTGRLGYRVSEVFLTEFHSAFPNIKIPTRDASTPKAQALQKKGAELIQWNPTDERCLQDAFQGADVIVDILNSQLPKEERTGITKYALESGPKVYFLSEFGIDHRQNDFPGYDLPMWEAKRVHAAWARALAGDATKVISVYTSLFLENAFEWIYLGDLAGFDVEKNQYVCIGPPNQRVAFTSTADIGRAAARLAVLALGPATAPNVPDHVRIAGSVVSYEDVRDLVAAIKGVEKGEIRSESLEEHKKSLPGEREKPGSMLHYIRVLMGESKLDFSRENQNELVNEGEGQWRWKTAEDELRDQL
ncbi:hypothetical protein V8D89_003702 [Ganoderma adspersum]